MGMLDDDTVYIARLPCGCVASTCDIWGDETDALWLYQVRGNGWTVERVSLDTPLTQECDQAAAIPGPWHQVTMF
jgi:hypothetical protein